MMEYRVLVNITIASLLAACAAVPEAVPSAKDKVTRAEAKNLACPARIIEVGATPEDCTCVENHLFEIGQKPGAIKYDSISPSASIGEQQAEPPRRIGPIQLYNLDTGIREQNDNDVGSPQLVQQISTRRQT